MKCLDKKSKDNDTSLNLWNNTLNLQFTKLVNTKSVKILIFTESHVNLYNMRKYFMEPQNPNKLRSMNY